MAMEEFDKEFIMEMFLESESVSSMNRLIVATTYVVKENNDNAHYTETFMESCNSLLSSEIEEKDVSSNQKRVKDFYENIVMNYNDEEYKAAFKMKRQTCQKLIKHLGNFTQMDTMTVPLEKKIHIFLWLLTSNSSFYEASILFGVQKSTISYIFYQIANLLFDQSNQFISWPTKEQQHLTRLKVNSCTGFPNCVGFIDTCRFRVGCKQNKKAKPDTVLLQAVCDDTLMFINTHIGEISKTKKNKIFKESPLSKIITCYVDFENHILGDLGYKLKLNLMTPFTTEEVLTREEMKYNDVHSRTRMYIGRAFELLKQRFRRLNLIDIKKTESVNAVIIAACVLHNFIIIHEGSPDMKSEKHMCEDGVTIDPSLVTTAAEKRMFLSNYISYVHITE